jgi:hypothetical protein
MNVFEKLDEWTALATRGMTTKEILDKYSFELVPEEEHEALSANTKPEYIKELCDLFIVLRPVAFSSGHFLSKAAEVYAAIYNSTGGNFSHALNAVLDSNLSKVIQFQNKELERDYFDRQGICFYLKPSAAAGYFACSTSDQTVAGKRYFKDKILKPSTYKPVDETKEFWL